VAELAVRDVTGLIDWMSREGGRRGQPLSRTTIADAVKVLAMALNLAVEDGLVSRNVAQSKSIELPRESRTQSEAKRNGLDYWPTTGAGDDATIPHMATFRDVSDLDPLAAAWRLTLCGFTRSEVLGFKWTKDENGEPDIDLDAGEVSVHRGRTPLDGGGDSVDDPKSDARWRTLRVEELQPGTVRLLRALSAKQAADRLRAGEAWEDSGYVVVDELGRPVKPRTYSDRFSRLCVAAGVPRIKLHNVRHSLAQLMIERRVPLDVAAATLGHTLQVFMSRYVRQSPKDRIKEHARAFVPAA
jgi:integrase